MMKKELGCKERLIDKARWGTHQENREKNSSIFIGKF